MLQAAMDSDTVGALAWATVWFHGTISAHLVHLFMNKISSNYFLRNHFAFLTLLPMVLLPFIIPSDAKLWRGVVSLASAFYTLRFYETITIPSLKAEKLLYRMFHVGVTFHDIRLRQKIVGSIYPELVEILKGLISHVVIAITSIAVIQNLPKSDSEKVEFLDIFFLFETIAGGLYITSSLYIFGYTLQLYHIPLRLKLPKLMNQPEESLSLREFWGLRWDTVVQKILKEYVYIPLRQGFGLSSNVSSIATFLASGLLHVYPLWVAGLDNYHALAMMSYFMFQIPLVFIETRLKIKDWGKSPARLWTISAAILPSVLFTDPVFRLAGIR